MFTRLRACFYFTKGRRLYPGYLCFFISLRKMIPVLLNISGILQHFVVKLEFTFQLYLICNEGWIIDERDSQLTKKWATLYTTLPPPLQGDYKTYYQIYNSIRLEFFHTTVSSYNSFYSIHLFTSILMFFKLPVWIWRGWTLFHSIEPFHHLIHFLLRRYSIIIL